jgi:hypothetical protein
MAGAAAAAFDQEQSENDKKAGTFISVVVRNGHIAPVAPITRRRDRKRTVSLF